MPKFSKCPLGKASRFPRSHPWRNVFQQWRPDLRTLDGAFVPRVPARTQSAQSRVTGQRGWLPLSTKQVATCDPASQDLRTLTMRTLSERVSVSSLTGSSQAGKAPIAGYPRSRATIETLIAISNSRTRPPDDWTDTRCGLAPHALLW